MIKTSAILLILFVAIFTLYIRPLSAEENIAEEAKKKAQEIHKVASSDIIYSDEEQKALYYQNIQIIELLKDVRSLLKQQLEALKEKEK